MRKLCEFLETNIGQLIQNFPPRFKKPSRSWTLVKAIFQMSFIEGDISRTFKKIDNNIIIKTSGQSNLMLFNLI